MLKLNQIVIKSCYCSHEYQDEKYGIRQRAKIVIRGSTTESFDYRCTVCGKIE